MDLGAKEKLTGGAVWVLYGFPGGTTGGAGWVYVINLGLKAVQCD
jgi:hypothetical protein